MGTVDLFTVKVGMEAWHVLLDGTDHCHAQCIDILRTPHMYTWISFPWLIWMAFHKVCILFKALQRCMVWYADRCRTLLDIDATIDPKC